MSSVFYIGSFLKNFGLIFFLGASVFVIYLAFKDTLKRGLYCVLVPPYHLYYALERLRHPWKKNINRVLFGGFWLGLIGVVFMKLTGVQISSALLGGVIQGSKFALMAFAIILIFRTTDLVNFAQADMAAIGAFFLLTMLGEGFGDSMTSKALSDFMVPMILAIPIALIFSGAFGSLTEMVFIKPVQKQHPISQIILTIGLGMFYINLASSKFVWDAQEHAVPQIIGGKLNLASGISIPNDGLLSLVVTLIIMAVIFSLFKYTLVGVALRATAQSQTTSKLMGINVNRVFIFSWAISVALGSLAAIFNFAGGTLNLTTDVAGLMLKGFAAAILGGFASLPGAVMGGFLLGIFDNFLALLTNSKDTLSFLIIILVLIIKPEGILGKSTTKKV